MSHTIVVDLGFGDAGKGATVDRLCASGSVHAVVRFNGGAQAAHNVVTDDGRHHTFAQFGSGMFHSGVDTHLSRFVLVEPLALAAEADHLRRVGVPNALDRITIDRDALLTTPFHAAANRAREIARGADRHGSCGIGVGETMAYQLLHPADAPRVGDSRGTLRRRLSALRDRVADEFGANVLTGVPTVDECLTVYGAFADRVRMTGEGFLSTLLRRGDVVFEGAQGVLLDEWHGFHPYTTWSTTTFSNAEQLLVEAGIPGEATRLGVLRTYTTRHGPGPFVTEDATLDVVEPHNGTGSWQGCFRVGHFDAVAHRYAIEVCGGVDALALTHLDRLSDVDIKMCVGYDPLVSLTPAPPGDLDRQARVTSALFGCSPVYDPEPLSNADEVERISAELNAPVALASTGARTGAFRELAWSKGSSEIPAREALKTSA